jgi:Protein of unknown function (DUF1153)
MIISKHVPTNASPIFRGPCGSMLNHSHLPASDVGRWTAQRRAIVVCAVKQGALSIDAALARYQMDAQELSTWMDGYRAGIEGLKNKTLLARPS